jgi:hypothetical protein
MQTNRLRARCVSHTFSKTKITSEMEPNLNQHLKKAARTRNLFAAALVLACVLGAVTSVAAENVTPPPTPTAITPPEGNTAFMVRPRFRFSWLHVPVHQHGWHSLECHCPPGGDLIRERLWSPGTDHHSLRQRRCTPQRLCRQARPRWQLSTSIRCTEFGAMRSRSRLNALRVHGY